MSQMKHKLPKAYTMPIESQQLVQEAMPHYVVGHPSSVPASFEAFLSDRMLVIQSIRQGASWSFFEAVMAYTQISEAEWASLLDLSTKSLQRYKHESGFRFRPLQSEKIIAMAELTLVGTDTFGGRERFNLWLTTTCFALGSEKPIELARTSYGMELVLAELHRINHGVFA
jgi:putative toxin-antitoxin system antitoxin component (TIGR02293 family)